MAKLLAQAAKASTTTGTKPKAAKKTTARKVAQPKPKAEDPAA